MFCDVTNRNTENNSMQHILNMVTWVKVISFIKMKNLPAALDLFVNKTCVLCIQYLLPQK